MVSNGQEADNGNVVILKQGIAASTDKAQKILDDYRHFILKNIDTFEQMENLLEDLKGTSPSSKRDPEILESVKHQTRQFREIQNQLDAILREMIRYGCK